MSVNKVILLGNVGRDPEIRYIDKKRAVATFPLATNERNPSVPSAPELTEWHNIVMWDGLAEMAEKYIRRGSRLYLEGKLRTRVWEDRSAIKRTVTEIYVERIELLGRSSNMSQN